MKLLRLIFTAFLLCVFGCSVAKVKVEMLSERTTLENQILGTYNALDDEMLLFASVRGVDPKGNIKKPKRHSRQHKDAISAMQVLDFHADDIHVFKKLGWIGENNQGLVQTFEIKKSDIPIDLKEFAQRYKTEEFNSVISQVNESREVIMRQVIDMNENLSENDMLEIRMIFGKLNAESALKGEKIQLAGGRWDVKR
jgi:hypothetical protein